MAQLVLEGTWEEIIRQAEQLAGKRVRLTVLEVPGNGASVSDEETGQRTRSATEVIRALDALAARNESLPVLPAEAFERESLYEDAEG